VSIVTVGCIPAVVTRCPWKITGERTEEEVQSPRDDDIVKEVYVEGDEDNCISDTW
jgi:hypothetical protein